MNFAQKVILNDQGGDKRVQREIKVKLVGMKLNSLQI